jgi:alanine racemase
MSAGPKLLINLTAIKNNYTLIQKCLPNSSIVPVVKSDAYGLGAINIVKALNVNEVYVSTLKEGLKLRRKFPNLTINVLNGFLKNELKHFLTHSLTPVINNSLQYNLWQGSYGQALLNIETGFNRLGLPGTLWQTLNSAKLQQKNIKLILTHFSCCADDLTLPHIQQHNKQQFENFNKAQHHFKGFNFSVSLDAALAGANNVAQIRTGAAIYGVQVWPTMTKLSPVITITAKVIDIATLEKGQNVGYSASWQAKDATTIATLAIGYSHGLPRSWCTKGAIYFKDKIAPITGAISMGLITCNVTDLNVKIGDTGQLLNGAYTINALCSDSKILDTNIMTNLKLSRHYHY